MSRRRCVICGDTFYSRVHTSRYCSKECLNVAKRKEQQNWRASNPDYMKNYMRKYREQKNTNKKTGHQIIKTRTCTRCGIEQEMTHKNFYVKSANRDNFDTWCKICKKKYDGQRYQKNKTEILKAKKEYYQGNKETIKARQREYYKSKKVHFS